jgi:hypothetical protein
LRLIGKLVGRNRISGHVMSARMYAFGRSPSKSFRSGRAAKHYEAESRTAVPRAVMGTIQAWRHSDGFAAMPKHMSWIWFSAAA